MKFYNKNNGFIHPHLRAAGFTLLEVLIALVVLSIGLLGVAGLQAKSQQFSSQAYLQTQATVLAHDMFERMRANPQGLIMNTYYNNPTASSNDNCFKLVGCSAQQMAQNDMYEWLQDVARTLPGGTATVCLDSTPDDGDSTAEPECDGLGKQYAVKVWWEVSEPNRVVTVSSFK